jgi:uncharacterized membrane protein
MMAPRRFLGRLCVLVLLAFVLVLGLEAGGAVAQRRSGGSFGGSRFGSRSRSLGGSRTGSYSGYYGGSYGSRRVGSAGDVMVIFLVATGMLVVPVLMRRKERSEHEQARRGLGLVASGAPKGTSPAWREVDVTRVRVSLSGDARPFLQAHLFALAMRGDTSSKRGLAHLLRDVTGVLRKSDAAWVHVAVDDFKPMSTIFAESTYRRLAQDARALFTDEVIRAADGATVQGEKTDITRSTERDGAGVVLVTLVVAARTEIRDVHTPSRERVMALLAQLGQIEAEDLVALEVVWMPAEDGDLVSTATLESLVPELVRLPGVTAGRVICPYCGGPHTAELVRCPHCGAPRRDAAAT